MISEKRRIVRLIAKADAGDVQSMLEYCSMFSDRDKIEADKEIKRRIVRYLKAGARAGDASMLCNLGAEYYGGGLLKQDFAKAIHYYELSAAKGCVQAISNLGYCYYYGRSIPVDYNKAFQCFLKAYILEGWYQPETCYKLGDCFRHGRGVPADPLVARKLYEDAYYRARSPKAADFKYCSVGWDRQLLGADAASRLGECYRLGIGCKVDLKSAAKYYRIAIAGFKRKIEFGDIFAPSLLDISMTRLREVKEAQSGKRPRRRGKFSLTIDAAGLQYADNWKRIFKKLAVGDEIKLLRDPGNAYDANAIAVMTAKGECFGWIPRAFNSVPASLLDRGVKLHAEIVDKGKMSDKSFVTISIKE